MQSGILTTFLKILCSDHLLDEKIFVVSSYSIGRQIGEAMAREGQSWVNLRFVTPTSLALEIAGEKLSEDGMRQISGTASRVLIHHIFRELKKNDELDYFGELEAQTGIINAIFQSIQDLRLAGIKSAALKPDFFIDPKKGQEIRKILQQYEKALDARKFFDIEQLYETASEIASKAPLKTERIYLCLENQIFSKEQKDFLHTLAGKKLILVPQGYVLGVDRPRRLTKIAKKDPKKAIPKPSTNLERAPWLFSLKDAPKPLKDKTLRMFQALGPTNECREVLRRIIREKIPFDQVEIIHPPGSIYPSLFYGLAEKSELPISLAEGLPISFTIPGKVCSAVVDWMEAGYPSASFCALVENEYLKTPEGDGKAPFPSMLVSRLLKEAKIGWGKPRYVQRLDVLNIHHKQKARTAEDNGDKDKAARHRESAKAVLRVKDWMRDILELFPSLDEIEEIDLSALSAGISAFLKKFCRVKNDMDGKALGRITSRLDEVSSFKNRTVPISDAMEWTKSLGSRLRVGASVMTSGHILLSPFSAGGYSGRLYTFIVGLNQAAVPGSRLPDPILLDEEREAISEDLVLTSDKLRENRFSMNALLSSLRGQAVLSFSAYDVMEDRLSFPSSFLLQVHRLLEGEDSLDYSSLIASFKDSSGFIPALSEKWDEMDWWLGFIAGGERFKDALAPVKIIFPFIASGNHARDMREGPDLCTYEGLIAASTEALQPCLNQDLVLSASQIETLARCPYRYFFRYVLRIKPPDVIVLDKAQWLDAMQRGSLLHDVFCEFMRGIRDSGEEVEPDKHRAVIRSEAEHIIAQHREENPPPSEPIFEREKQEIFATLDIFLRAEARRKEKVELLLFEANFGFEEEEGEGITDSVSIEVKPGVSFRLHGRIDRVDRTKRGDIRVVDYKTGNYGQYEKIKSFGRGQYLQHALYAEAAEKIIRIKGIDPAPRVKWTGYAFPTWKGDGREILIENYSRTKLRELLLELFSFLETGRFLVNPETNCSFCDYSAVCGKDVIDRTKIKIETNAGEFAIFGRLKEYE